MLKQFRRKGRGEKLRLNLACGLRLSKALSRLEKLGSRLCPPCRVRTVGTFVWGVRLCRIGLLRFTAELRLGLTRRLRGLPEAARPRSEKTRK